MTTLYCSAATPWFSLSLSEMTVGATGEHNSFTKKESRVSCEKEMFQVQKLSTPAAMKKNSGADNKAVGVLVKPCGSM
jgi:hypothetical protein